MTAVLVLLVSCAMPGDAAPVVKVGLIAPFEGLGRPLGYALLSEVRAAVAEANASGAFGRYRVALIALNDDLDPPTAARQAQALAQDDDVLAVIGPFDQATAAAAAPILSAAGIPTLVFAPLAQEFPGVWSLCPSAHKVEGVLAEAAAAIAADGLPAPWVHFPGDAASAADAVVRLRAQGNEGVMLLGPDAVRPWFIQRAGAAAEGTRAVVCDLPGSAWDDAVLPVVGLSRAGVVLLIEALSSAAHGELRRPTVAAALASRWSAGQLPAAGGGLTPGLRWYRVEDGRWQPVTQEMTAP